MVFLGLKKQKDARFTPTLYETKCYLILYFLLYFFTNIIYVIFDPI